MESPVNGRMTALGTLRFPWRFSGSEGTPARSGWGGIGLIFLALAGAVVLGAETAWAKTTARVEQAEVGEAEPFELILENDSGQPPEVELAPLEKDFVVQGSASGSRVEIVNGRMRGAATLTVTLLPKRTGQLTIPSLTVAGGETTSPIPLTVIPAGSAVGGAPGSGKERQLFLEMAVDDPSPYVQGQVLLSVRLFRSVPLSGGEIVPPTVADAIIEPLGEGDETRREVGGKLYQVIERRFALFPQKSGPLPIPGAVFDGQMLERGRRSGGPSPFGNDPFGGIFGQDPFGGLFQKSRPVHLLAAPVTLQVRPRPPASGAAAWLPARQLLLTERWEPARGPYRVGEPVTRVLSLHAVGLTGQTLPSLPVPSPAGLRIYPDQPALKTRGQGDRILGEREERWAIVPLRDGRFLLPPIRLAWWDLARDREAVVELPEHLLEVVPAAGDSVPSPPASDPTGGSLPPTAAGGAAPDGGGNATGAVEAAPPAAETYAGTAPPAAGAAPDGNGGIAGTAPPAAGTLPPPATGAEAASGEIAGSSPGGATLPPGGSSPPVSGEAVPPAGGSSPPMAGEAVSPAGGSGGAAFPWFWLAVFFLAAWLVTLILWWHRVRSGRRVGPRSRVGPAVDEADISGRGREGERAALRAIEGACSGGGPGTVREALLRWGRSVWADDPPLTLEALARRLEPAGADPGAGFPPGDAPARLFAELERCLYGDGGTWDGGGFWR
ncbi:MAG: BatD family protein, partial [Magnetococcales bacterium]|nr:BatD family protein [Magnetococcales bacterium]